MVDIGRLSFHNLRRWLPGFFSTHRTLFFVLWIVGFATVFLWQSSSVDGLRFFRRARPVMAAPKLRPVSYDITDFGGVGLAAPKLRPVSYEKTDFGGVGLAAPKLRPVSYDKTDFGGVGLAGPKLRPVSYDKTDFGGVGLAAPKLRPVSYDITDFGGVRLAAPKLRPVSYNITDSGGVGLAAPKLRPVLYDITDFGGVRLAARKLRPVSYDIKDFGGVGLAAPKLRPVSYDITDFGGVGDGVTLNTEAFERAVAAIARLGRRGGGQLNVLPGVWLTAPFNLTSHMTLFLAEGAEIRGIEDERYWPLMPPLPSYGFGREHKGPRYGSLIHGQNLKDLVITGHNGTINGQGQAWWTKYRKRLLNNTRGPLVQIMWSKDIIISNITLRDSPFWTLHPFDCKNVTVTNVTILAPVNGAPNTDGIDPDSCEDMVIENCYICVGDDGIAIKSGWDQYGIAYGHPSTNILIRNLTVRSVVSAGVSIGSEMSGGVSNVMVESLIVWESSRGIRIKTAPGRGGYIRNISFHNVTFDNVRIGIIIQTDYNEHPDEGFDPRAVPPIENISFSGIHGQGVRVPVRIHGSEDIPVKRVSFRNMSVGITYKKKHIFQCSFVRGRVIGSIFPAPCENLDLYDEQGQLVRRSVS